MKKSKYKKSRNNTIISLRVSDKYYDFLKKQQGKKISYRATIEEALDAYIEEKGE